MTTAMNEPVLPGLQTFADRTDLEWREILHLARGLEAAGDRERSRVLLDRLLEKGMERDAVLAVEVSENRTEVYEATADAAALALKLAHPKAEALQTFVNTNWQREAFPVLAKTRYALAALATLPSRDISLTYATSPTQSETLTFSKESVITRTFTEDEIARLVITRVDGPVDIVFVRRSYGRPATVPEVSIRRTYTENPKEGDVVRITLQYTISPKAQDGCYVVRDHLPGSMQAVLNWSAGYNGTWPTSIENGEVSFYACKDPQRPLQSLTYVARVVARGTYRAEAPVIQHMQYPAIAAIGEDIDIETK